MNRDALEGWRWPGAVSPASLVATPFGRVKVRHPGPDPAPVTALGAVLRGGAHRLRKINTREMTALLGDVCRRFLCSIDGRAVRRATANAGLSGVMMREILEGLSAGWSGEALRRLVAAEFPDPAVLDGFVRDDDRMVRAAAPGFTVILGAGTVPGVTITAMIRALLVRSAVLAKPGAGDVALTVQFAREAASAHPSLGEAVAVQYWPGGGKGWGSWEEALFRAADQVIVHGSDATIESVRARAPASTRIVEHPGRVGVAVVDPVGAPAAAAEVARAATIFEQRGCVSTQLVFLLTGSALSPRIQKIASDWCEELARCLSRLGSSLPRTVRDPGQLSRVHQLRGRVELRRAATSRRSTLRPELWRGAEGGWTVILDRSEHFEPCGGRTIQVVPLPDRAACLDALQPLRPLLQTLGLAGIGPGRAEFAEALAELGATRIVPVASVPFPDSTWLHDGSRPLGELVRWCELRNPAE